MRPLAIALAAIIALLSIVSSATIFAQSTPAPASPARPWPLSTQRGTAQTLAQRLPPPPGFQREPAAAGSWAAWLRALPVKPASVPVLLHTGAPKPLQSVHAAVLDIDVGPKDLQQCADAIMRLRAEWLWSAQRHAEIAFTYTGGGRVAYTRWAAGERPSPDGKTWKAGSAADLSYAQFRRYLEHVMIYAGTASLEKELRSVKVEEIAIGDVFIKGGFPGHAVLVVDLARNGATGETRFLLAQSYMPAQDIHVLKNPAATDNAPWYATSFGAELVTPEWTFARTALRRWPAAPPS